MNSTSKIIVSTLAGVGAGVLIGMLFAPEKGTETRRKIGEKYTDLSDGIKDKITELVDTVKDEYGVAKEKASGIVNRATGKTPSMKSDPTDTFNG